MAPSARSAPRSLPPGVTRHQPAAEARPNPGPFPAAARGATLLALARELGFHAAALTDAGPLVDAQSRLEAWLDAGYGGNLAYLAGRRCEPAELLPGARSALVVALAYGSQAAPIPRDTSPPPGGATASESDRSLTHPANARVARYACGADYHGVLKTRLRALADRTATLLGESFDARACVDTAPLLERALAARAGLGFIGKNTLLIVRGLGSYVVLGVLLTTLELEGEVGVAPGCGNCNLCLTSCPTSAFPAPFVLDARRCISALTIEKTSEIPEAIQPLVDSWVFGCDVCQQVCPYNAGEGARRADPELLKPGLREYTLPQVLSMSSGEYRRWVKGTALRRTSRDQLARNAAVALGNAPSRVAVPALLKALESDPRAALRLQCIGSLSRHSGERVRRGLQQSRDSDPDPDVRRAAGRALLDVGLEIARAPREQG